MESPAFVPALSLNLPTNRRRATTRRRRMQPVALVGASSLLRELNDSYIRELSGLVINFGEGPYTWDALTSVRATRLDEDGLSIESVMCDGAGCVCARENIDWPDGRAANVDEAISKLRQLVAKCGLDADVLNGLEGSTVLRG